MGKETSLRELLRDAVGVQTATIVTGKVTKTSPLEISVDNDAKLILDESNTFVPQHLTDYSVSIYLSGTIDGHSIGTRSGKIYNALKKGDEVYLLAYEEGALYYVLDRVGGD